MDRKEIEKTAFDMFTSYYPFLTIYKKAMIDICKALEKGEIALKERGMNNTKGSIAIIEAAMDNIEQLALFQSFDGCKIPEKYQKKYEKYLEKKRGNKP